MPACSTAGCIAAGATTVALAFDGISAAPVMVTAAAARLRNNLRILVPLHVMCRPRRDSTRAIQSLCCLAHSEPVQRGGNITAPL
jgi:hypothetical protein